VYTKTLKKAPPGVGDPEYIFLRQVLFFGDLKFRAKFHNPRTATSGRKVCGTEKKKEKKNNHKNYGPLTYPSIKYSPNNNTKHYGRCHNVIDLVIFTAQLDLNMS
jgi:hypothetical protein